MKAPEKLAHFPMGRRVAIALVLGASVAFGQTAPPPYLVSTIAGTSSRGSVDGSGAAARFYAPNGMAIDAAGNIYLAERWNHSIRRVTPGGVVTTFAGRADEPGDQDGPLATARFLGPRDLAFDAVGNLYVVDELRTVRKIDPAGNVTTFAGRAEGGTYPFTALSRIAVDPAGNVYVADEFQIWRISPAGTREPYVGAKRANPEYQDGVGADAKFGWIQGLTADATGALYVADGTARVIRRVGPDRVVTTLAGTNTNGAVVSQLDGIGAAARFTSPGDLGIDPGGNLYVTDDRLIRRITPDGTVTTLAGRGGGYAAEDGSVATALLAYVTAVEPDRTGVIWFADGGANTVRRIANGQVTTLAGLEINAAWGSADGPGPNARFSEPWGIAADAVGNLLVVDHSNHTLRRVAADGTVSTVAGTAGEAGFADGQGAAARFSYPADVAVDVAGNAYVSDTGNHVIRRISPAGLVTVFAGKPGESGTTDGVGSNARFGAPRGLAIDAAGTLWVADGLHLRRVSPAGEVSTAHEFDYLVAGNWGRFFFDVAVNAAGDVYVSRWQDNIARKIGNEVSEVPVATGIAQHLAFNTAGRLILGGGDGPTELKLLGPGDKLTTLVPLDQGAFRDGLGSKASVVGVLGVAAGPNGTVYFTDTGMGTYTVRRAQPASSPVIGTSPQSLTVGAGGSAQFSVTAAAVPEAKYQWLFNGNPISGATGAAYQLSGVQAAQAGNYAVTVSNELGSVTSAAATLTVTSAPSPGTGGNGGSGSAAGGGAPSLALLGALATVATLRWRCRLLARA
ncbi:MAG TPA: immunoglobulin domain-containing protein [Lacunisphaera sp.]|nr:immunoglobulin domain-containing protein [Lacunisphaera sp.]